MTPGHFVVILFAGHRHLNTYLYIFSKVWQGVDLEGPTYTFCIQDLAQMLIHVYGRITVCLPCGTGYLAM